MAKKTKTPKFAQFNTSPEDHVLIAKIVKRIVAHAKKHKIKYSVKDAGMDITACHVNGTPLRLQELLDAPDADFGHDVFGIRRFIDRMTGEIPHNKFTPRFAGRSKSSK